MHELSLCQNIIHTVQQHTHCLPAKVKTVKVTVGDLLGVDIESLSFWFNIVAKKQGFSNTTLEVVKQMGKAQCKSCQNIFVLSSLYDACCRCKSHKKQILSGQDLSVISILYNH
jgi:hydrogenase nickel incorporation protein HypA/HybF